MKIKIKNSVITSRGAMPAGKEIELEHEEANFLIKLNHAEVFYELKQAIPEQTIKTPEQAVENGINRDMNSANLFAKSNGKNKGKFK